MQQLQTHYPLSGIAAVVTDPVGSVVTLTSSQIYKQLRILVHWRALAPKQLQLLRMRSNRYLRGPMGDYCGSVGIDDVFQQVLGLTREKLSFGWRSTYVGFHLVSRGLHCLGQLRAVRRTLGLERRIGNIWNKLLVYLVPLIGNGTNIKEILVEENKRNKIII